VLTGIKKQECARTFRGAFCWEKPGAIPDSDDVQPSCIALLLTREMRIRRVILKKSWNCQYLTGIKYLLCAGMGLQGVMGTLNQRDSKWMVCFA